VEAKLNCWEVIGCGREPGGKASEKGACPSATDATADSVNHGKNGGRICWAIAGTMCFGRRQPSVPRKRALCQLCPFFRRVQQEEGACFQMIRLTPPAPGMLGEVEETAWLRHKVNNLARLLMACQDIIRRPEVNTLLRTFAEQACRICGAERGVVYLLKSGEKRRVATAVFDQGVVGFEAPIAEESVAGDVAKHNTFVNLLDASEEPTSIFPELRADRSSQERYGFPVRNVLAVPIYGDSEAPSAAQGEQRFSRDIIGGLEVLNKQGGHFTETDEWLLAEVAVIAGPALHSAQLRQPLEEIRRFGRAKAKFVALLTHQIVSPLATAYTCVSTLRKLAPRLSSQDRESLMQGALDRVVGVQELAKKLLDLAAIQEGQALADCKAVDIFAALRKEVDRQKEAAEAKDIPLLVELPAAASRIFADLVGLGIIFANLLENAIQYSERGSEVIVSGRIEQGGFLASVRDHGPGIPDQDLPRIFDEFFRGPSAVRNGIVGSGLGLTFVKALVARYGGSIYVESQLGQGSTFTVSFPCI
jgi:signal transduction histidine kinase